MSIIIINYNTFHYTCECIASIKKETGIPYEIILIDNASMERPAKDFLCHFPEITLVELKENIGFGGANNLAIQKANGDYILLLNSDSLILDNAIDKVFNYAAANIEIDILGCLCKNPDGTEQLTVYENANEKKLVYAFKIFINKNAIYWFVTSGIKYVLRRIRKIITGAGTTRENWKLKFQDHTKNNIGSILGVFLMLKKKVYEETKGFDPDFFMYYEETEWFINRLEHYKKEFYPDAAIIHYGGKSDVDNTMAIQEKLSEYLFWFKISHFHYWTFVVFNLVNIPSNFIVGIITLRKRFFNAIKTTWLLLPYAFFDIPRYSNNYYARRQMLKYTGKKAIIPLPGKRFNKYFRG